MPIISVTVENPDELLNVAYLGAGALGRVERSAIGGGAGYAEISTFAIVAGTRLYTVYDLAGAVDSWYRIRYSKSDGTSPSLYGDEFQGGDETAGLLCSVYDVAQRVTDSGVFEPNDAELALDLIREVSSEIEDYLSAWMAPRPTNPTSTTALVFDVAERGRSIALVSGGQYVGIRTAAAVGIAVQSQPDVGGVYTTLNAADVLIRPRPTVTEPGYRLVLSQYPTSGYTEFYPGESTLSVTGSFGPAAVPPWCQGIAIAAVIRRWLGKETASPAIALGPDGGVRLLADISPGMQATLERHRFRHVP